MSPDPERRYTPKASLTVGQFDYDGHRIGGPARYMAARGDALIEGMRADYQQGRLTMRSILEALYRDQAACAPRAGGGAPGPAHASPDAPEGSTQRVADHDTAWVHTLLATPEEIDEEMALLLALRPDPPEPEPGSPGAALYDVIRTSAAGGMSLEEIRHIPAVAAHLQTLFGGADAERLRDHAIGRCIIRRVLAGRCVPEDGAGAEPLTLDQIRAVASAEVSRAPVGDDLKDTLRATLAHVLSPAVLTSDVLPDGVQP